MAYEFSWKSHHCASQSKHIFMHPTTRQILWWNRKQFGTHIIHGSTAVVDNRMNRKTYTRIFYLRYHVFSIYLNETLVRKQYLHTERERMPPRTMGPSNQQATKQISIIFGFKSVPCPSSGYASFLIFAWTENVHFAFNILECQSADIYVDPLGPDIFKYNIEFWATNTWWLLEDVSNKCRCNYDQWMTHFWHSVYYWPEHNLHWCNWIFWNMDLWRQVTVKRDDTYSYSAELSKKRYVIFAWFFQIAFEFIYL